MWYHAERDLGQVHVEIQDTSPLDNILSNRDVPVLSIFFGRSREAAQHTQKEDHGYQVDRSLVFICSR